jgi:SH2 domain
MCVCRWFHGKISREEAEKLLWPRKDGLFLVRESTNYPGDYTLCVCFQDKVEHYRVKYKDNQLTIDDEEFFQTLAQLVEVIPNLRVVMPKLFVKRFSTTSRMRMACVLN